MYRHGTGRASDLWRRLMAVDWDGGKMRGMDVYRGGGDVRRGERTTLEREWWRRGREMRREREGITSISDWPFSNPNYAVPLRHTCPL
jgi:hypothetical protein